MTGSHVWQGRQYRTGMAWHYSHPLNVAVLSHAACSKLSTASSMLAEANLNSLPTAACVLHVCFASPSETTAVTEIGPYKVPEGIVVWPMIYALQNSINNWEDPEDFNPVSDSLACSNAAAVDCANCARQHQALRSAYACCAAQPGCCCWASENRQC